MPFERPIWPDGARCAVTLTFDNFGESLDLLRYGHAGGASADGVYAPRRALATTPVYAAPEIAPTAGHAVGRLHR